MSSFLLPTVDLWGKLKAETRPILIYGMGDGADKLISRLEALSIPYADVFASDGFVRGQSFHGKRVLSFSEAIATYPHPVILLSFATRLPNVIAQIESIAKKHTLYVPDMPVAGEDYFDLALFSAHKAEIEQAEALFKDPTSRMIFWSAIEAKLTGSLDALLRGADTPQDSFFKLNPAHFTTAFDAGAYNGDTIKTLLPCAPHLENIIALEPDPHTFARLEGYASQINAPIIKAVWGAAWHEQTTLPFSKKGNRGSHTGKGGKTIDVPTYTIDQLCVDTKLDYLKFDVEGAEKNALEGAKETIRKCRPSILLSLYHRAEDLFALPLQLSSMCPNYTFYLQRTLCLPCWELNLLAVPCEKMLPEIERNHS